MGLLIGLMLLPLLVWSWRRGNGEDGDLALGIAAWLGIVLAGVAAWMVWG